MAPKIQAVFFDLGDTLVRISFVTLAKICKRISDVRGTRLNTDEYTRAFRNEWDNRSNPSETKLVKDIKTGADESERQYWKNFFESLLPSLGISSDQPELTEWLIHVYTDPQSFVCFDDVHRVLSELKNTGLMLGVISNAFPSADRILDHLNLRRYFKFIFLSFELPYAKPESKVYQFAAEKTDILIENIIFVDDRWSFVKGAQESHMNAWLIERFPESPSRLFTKSLVKKINNLKELMEIIDFSQIEEVNTSQEQKPLLIGQRDKFWNLSKLPTSSSSIPVGRNSTTPREKQQYLRIFLASPGDVEAERTIAYKVINDVEEILRIFKDHNLAGIVQPLRALGWEKVPSNAGLPNQVILDRFPIEESDIFIFILWKRLGTPPRTQSMGAKFFSSGTEEEFIRAFEQRRKGPNGRPIIMLYRKTDDSSMIGKDDREIKQYRKVLRFFRECEPDGKYPTLIFDFKTNDFEITLRRHLLDNILNLYKKFGEDGTPEDKKNIIQEKQDESFQEDLSAKSWFELNNLSGDPFHLRFAEDEVDLTKYYVRFKNLQLRIDYLLNDKNSWLIFGREGSGKTALRKFLVAKRQNNPQVCCIEYSDERKFFSALAEEQDAEKIALSIAAQIYEISMESANIKVLGLRNAMDPSSIFLLLRDRLKTQGIEQILILIDPFREAVKNIAKVSSVLAQLANISIDGIGLRFFLPKSIYMTLSNKQHSYIGRCNPMEIKWETNELLDLIRHRLIYYSKDKRNVNSSMGALGEPKGGMDRIDQAIVGLSENNPRAVIWLADKLISKHCQSQPIPIKIQRQTWDQVQEEWWSWGRNYILGLSGQEDGFWRSGSDIYFKDVKINLSKRSKALMGILIEAEGQICTKEKLIEAGWKNESKEGISKPALREAIRRLKLELTKNNINPGWVKTVHNQGYQLQNPDSDTLKQED